MILAKVCWEWRIVWKLGRRLCGSLDELDALEQAHDLEEAQDLDDAKNTLGAAHRDLGSAPSALLETRFTIKIEGLK